MQLNIFASSDWHLGHSKVPTRHVLEGIAHYLLDPEFLKSIDYCLISGDIFDKLLMYNADEVRLINGFFTSFFRMCNTYKVKVRILKGTTSHDRDQPRTLVRINDDLTHESCDLIYVETLDIIKEEEGFYALYIPDNWGSSQDCWRQVKEKMSLLGIDHVHMASTHGYWEHLIPKGVKEIDCHNNSDYKEIVKWFIDNGHVHNMAIEDIIYNNGGWDAYRSDEQGKKGGFLFTVDTETDYCSAKFIENKKAYKRIDLDISELDFDDARKAIKEIIKTTQDAFVRVIMKKAQVSAGVYNSVDFLNMGSENLVWDKKVVDMESSRLSKSLEQTPDVILVENINPSSVFNLIQPELHKRTLDENLIAKVLDKLKDYTEV